MRAIIKHWVIQLKLTASSTFAAIVLLLCAVTSLFFWPGIIDSSGAIKGVSLGGDSLSGAAIYLLWVVTWSMMAGFVVPGQVLGGKPFEVFATRALPTLPIGPRARVVAEVLVVLTFIIAVRGLVLIAGTFPGVSLVLHEDPGGQSAFRTRFLIDSAMGMLLVLPALLIWASPARNIHFWLVKPLILLCLLLVSMKLGFLAEPLRLTATSIGLSILCLWSVNREPTLPRLWNRSAGSSKARWRRGIPPMVRLRRDLWLKPLPLATVIVAVEALLIALNQFVDLTSNHIFYAASSLNIGMGFSFIAFRPMANNLIAVGLSVASASRPSDFRGAWAVLPVRPESVMRGVYLHGLATGFFLWLTALGTNLANTWLKTGVFRFEDFDGDPGGRLLVPLVAAVPCLAGGLTSAAAGDGVRGWICLVSGMGVFVGNMVCLGTKVPWPSHAALLLLLAAAGGIPPLVHLRGRTARAPGDG